MLHAVNLCVSKTFQVFNYRGVSLRDDTSDVDFFLLQSCATVLTSDHFFAIILDRFDLRGFLTDVPKSEMELGLMVVLVEEFLAFLVQLLTDRSRLSLQTTAEMSRLEIIQVL